MNLILFQNSFMVPFVMLTLCMFTIWHLLSSSHIVKGGLEHEIHLKTWNCSHGVFNRDLKCILIFSVRFFFKFIEVQFPRRAV